jgi:hypothetical protein
VEILVVSNYQFIVKKASIKSTIIKVFHRK